MDLEVEILREHSKRQALRVAAWAGRDPRRFRRLVQLFLRVEPVVTQRAAWALGLCANEHPALVTPHLRALVQKMQEPGVHDAVKRNVVRILQTADIPQELLGTVATVCFDFLSSPSAPIAVRAYSMTVLARIAGREPDLRRELRLVIEQQLPYGSPGIRAHARKVLKGLDKTPEVSEHRRDAESRRGRDRKQRRRRIASQNENPYSDLR